MHIVHLKMIRCNLRRKLCGVFEVAFEEEVVVLILEASEYRIDH